MVLLRAGIVGWSRQSIKKGPFYSVGILVVPALKEEGVGGKRGLVGLVVWVGNNKNTH